MLRIYGLPRDQMAALLRVMADNESFESGAGAPQLGVIEGGRRGENPPPRRERRERVAQPLQVVG